MVLRYQLVRKVRMDQWDLEVRWDPENLAVRLHRVTPEGLMVLSDPSDLDSPEILPARRDLAVLGDHMVPKAPKGPGDRWNPEVLKNRYFLKCQRGRWVLMGRGDLGDHLVLAVQEIQLGLVNNRSSKYLSEK